MLISKKSQKVGYILFEIYAIPLYSNWSYLAYLDVIISFKVIKNTLSQRDHIKRLSLHVVLNYWNQKNIYHIISYEFVWEVSKNFKKFSDFLLKDNFLLNNISGAKNILIFDSIYYISAIRQCIT